MTEHDALVEIAQRVVQRFEESGYGTTRQPRWTPTFEPLDVVALAHAVLGTTEPEPSA